MATFKRSTDPDDPNEYSTGRVPQEDGTWRIVVRRNAPDGSPLDYRVIHPGVENAEASWVVFDQVNANPAAAFAQAAAPVVEPSTLSEDAPAGAMPGEEILDAEVVDVTYDEPLQLPPAPGPEL